MPRHKCPLQGFQESSLHCKTLHSKNAHSIPFQDWQFQDPRLFIPRMHRSIPIWHIPIWHRSILIKHRSIRGIHSNPICVSRTIRIKSDCIAFALGPHVFGTSSLLRLRKELQCSHLACNRVQLRIHALLLSGHQSPLHQNPCLGAPRDINLPLNKIPVVGALSKAPSKNSASWGLSCTPSEILETQDWPLPTQDWPLEMTFEPMSRTWDRLGVKTLVHHSQFAAHTWVPPWQARDLVDLADHVTVPPQPRAVLRCGLRVCNGASVGNEALQCMQDGPQPQPQPQHQSQHQQDMHEGCRRAMQEGCQGHAVRPSSKKDQASDKRSVPQVLCVEVPIACPTLLAKRRFWTSSVGIVRICKSRNPSGLQGRPSPLDKGHHRHQRDPAQDMDLTTLQWNLQERALWNSQDAGIASNAEQSLGMILRIEARLHVGDASLN